MPMLASRAAAALRNWGYSGTTLILRLRDTYWKYVTLLLRGNNADTDIGLSASPDVLAFNRDSSSNNFALTLAGDTKPSVYNPYQNGYYSCFFDGTGDYLSVAVASSVFYFGTGDFTVECWVHPTAAYGSLSRMFIAGPGGGSGYFTFYINSSGQIVAAPSGSAGITTTGTVPLFAWTHIAISRASGTTKVFINGVVSGSAADASNYTATTVVYIGTDGSGNYFNGYISNLRVVKGISLYKEPFTPSISPLKAIANTILLTCQANRLIDNSPAKSVITKAGDTYVRQSNPFAISYSATIPSGYSVYFDGSGNDNLTVATSTAFGMGTGDFTVEFWTYWTGFLNTLNGGTIVDFRNWPDTQAFVIYLHTNGVLRYYDGPANTEYDSGVTLKSGTWNYIALTRATGVWRLFLNGMLVKSHTNASDLGSTKPVRIGQGAHAIASIAGTDYRGFISNFRVIKGQALYTDTFTVPTSALTAVANTSLLTCQDFVFKDNSTNAFTVTPSGDTVTGGFHPFGDPSTVRIPPSYYGVYFDGTGDYLSVANNAAIDVGTGDFTLECWVYKTTASTDWRIAGGSVSGSGFFGEQASQIGFGISAVEWTAYYAGKPIPSNAWSHVAWSRSSNTMYVFINGVLAGSTSVTGKNYGLNGGSFYIGSEKGTGLITGTISNFRLVKGTGLYTAAFTPSTTPLTAVSGTGLLTCQSSTIIDGSSNTFTVTAVGDAKPVYVNLAEATTSIDVSSYGSGYFDGNGDYLIVPATSAFSIPTNTTPFTVEAWVYLTSSTTQQYILTDSYTGSGNPINLYAGFSNGGADPDTAGLYPVLAYYTGSAWAKAAVSSAAITTNTWYHVAYVFTGSTTKIFINGVDSTAAGAASTWGGQLNNNGDAWWIGRRWDTGGSVGNYTQGYLSNLRFVKGTAVYTTTFIPPVQPLTAVTNTQLLTLQTCGALTNNFIIDAGTNNLAVTRVGNTTRGTFTPAGGGWSVYFDGSGDYLTSSAATGMLPTGTGDFTMECWYYKMNTGKRTIIGGNGTGSIFVQDAGTTLDISRYGVAYIHQPSYTNPLNTWIHLAVVKASNVYKTFVNGVAIATSTDANSLVDGTVYVGKNPGNTSEDLQGYVSNFRITKGQALYTATFTPSITPLAPITSNATVYTSLLTCNDSYLKDWSQGNNTITKTGDARIERRNPFGNYRLTATGNSYLFAGSGSYLVVSDTIDMYAQPITIEGWLFPTTSGYAPIVEENTGGSNGEQLMYINSSQFVVFEQRNTHGYGSTIGLTSTATAPINTWTHFALCLTTAGPRLYVNGVQSATDATVRYWNNAGRTFSIGLNGYGGTGFPGYISNLRVSKGVRYTATFTPSTTPFVADSATSLLTCSTTVIADQSFSANTITVTGTVRPLEFNPFGYTNVETDSVPTSVGTSLNFDGNDYLTTPNINFGTRDFTVECWVYFTTTSTSRIVCSRATGGGATGTWSFSMSTTTIAFTEVVAGEPGPSATISSVYNVWAHVAACRASGVTKLFVNGAQVASAAQTTDFNNASYLVYIATSPSENYVQGYISDLRILNGFARYKAPFVPSRTTLPALSSYSLALNPTTVGIYDSAGQVILSTEGNSTLSVAQKKYGSSSLYFDGTGDYLLFNMVERILPMQTWTTGTWTWECWVYQIARHTPSSSWDWPTMCCGPGGYMTMGLTSTGKLRLQWYIGGSGGERRATGTTTVALATWTHIAICVTAGAIKFFINGVQDTYDGSYVNSQSTILNNPAVTTGTFLIGGGSGYGDFNGYMDDFRIHNGYARYTGNFDPPGAMVAAGPLS